MKSEPVHDMTLQPDLDLASLTRAGRSLSKKKLASMAAHTPRRHSRYLRFAPLLNLRIDPTLDVMMRSLKLRRETAVLDIGSGDGALSNKFARHVGAIVHAVERDPEPFSALLLNNRSGFNYLEDAQEFMKRTDASFDVILFSHVFYYFPFSLWGPIISQARRCARPGAPIVIVNISRSSECFAGEWANIFNRAKRLLPSTPPRRDGRIVFAEDIQKFASANGFKFTMRPISWTAVFQLEGAAIESVRNAIMEFFAFIYRIPCDQFRDFVHSDNCISEKIYRTTKLEFVDSLMILET